jgi:hypothetical protein
MKVRGRRSSTAPNDSLTGWHVRILSGRYRSNDPARFAVGMGDSSLLEVDRVRIGAGGAGLLVVTAGLVAVGMPTFAFTATLGVVTAVFASAVGRPGAALLGLTGWALCTGFGINELGQLTFAPADLLRLSAYVACALVLGGDRLPAQ